MQRLFVYLDEHRSEKKGKLLNQLFPVGVCAILFLMFISASHFFIDSIINPLSSEKILYKLYPVDIAVGFFLYFVTAIDYALVVGRMQTKNNDSRSRFVMNVFTCVGGFVGVSSVLFLWGLGKEITLFIIPLLLFAGSVMIKLAYEGHEYFVEAESIPQFIRTALMKILNVLYYPARFMTFWMPEIGTPSIEKLSVRELIKWSFIIPFIVGLDDLIGYMGAMTIYNVASLLVGIYFADVFIDILIFVSPAKTKKLVENALLSILAAVAFLYLAYKSFSESLILASEHFHTSLLSLISLLVGVIAIVFIVDSIKFTLGERIVEHVRGRFISRS